VISVVGEPFDAQRKTLYFNASPGYFETMGMAFIDGRDLAPLSRTDLPLDAVINEEMARRYWPGTTAVGRRFEISGREYEVVGHRAQREISQPHGKAAAVCLVDDARAIHLLADAARARGERRSPRVALRRSARRFGASIPS
jgi:hypothetical protein